MQCALIKSNCFSVINFKIIYDSFSNPLKSYCVKRVNGRKYKINEISYSY